ncbi:hypothetical protein EJB05_18774, partial [Eragrostis curvula]
MSTLLGPLKNALDWGSRPPNCWADRAAAILRPSLGGILQNGFWHCSNTVATVATVSESATVTEAKSRIRFRSYAKQALSASGGSGGSRSQYHIRTVGVFLDIHFINKPEVFTKAHQPPKKFDDDGNLIDPETKEQLRKMLLSLQAFALRLQGKSANS